MNWKRKIPLLVTLIVSNLLIGLGCWMFAFRHELAHPKSLFLLVSIPVLSVMFFLAHNKVISGVNYNVPEKVKESMSSLIRLPLLVPFILRMIGIAALIIAIARPQSASSDQFMTKEGIDIVISMDVSQSMLSLDFEKNRLESSKAVAAEFVEKRPNDRIGVVVYEAESYTQVPLTSDHRVVIDALSAVQSGLIQGGTAIGMGLATAINRLKDSDAKSKVVILLTDGLNNSGQIDPIDAAQMAKLYGVKVYTIGVGKKGKAKMPVQMSNGQTTYQWMEVEIDEEVLKEVAKTTNGKYYRAQSKEALSKIYAEIDELERTEFNVTQIHRKTEEFLNYALFSLLCFSLGFILKHTVFRTTP